MELERGEEAPDNTVDESRSSAGEFEERLREATRLKNMGENEFVLDKLEDVSRDGLSDFQEGQLEGTQANALQNLSRHDSTVEAYQRAIASFEGSGRETMAGRAQCQQAVSLRELKRYEEAERSLRSFIETREPGPLKA